MKLLMLNYEFPPIGGGAANATFHLLKEFSKKKDIKIDLITSSISDYEEYKFSENITLYRLNIGKKDKHYWKFSEILRWTLKTYIVSISVSTM